MSERMKLEKCRANNHVHYVLDGVTFCGIREQGEASEFDLLSCPRCAKIAEICKSYPKQRRTVFDDSIKKEIMSFRINLDYEKKSRRYGC